jgi:predicted DNA binding CopG/RHH family protein
MRAPRGTAGAAEHLDWARAEIVRLPNLKPSTITISLRIPIGLLERIKIEVAKHDLPYQSLIEIWLA